MTVTQRHFKTREVQFKHYRKVFEVLISTVIAKKNGGVPGEKCSSSLDQTNILYITMILSIMKK